MNGPQILMLGNLTHDPKVQYSRSKGTPFVRVGIAVHTNLGPDQDTETTFFETTFWNRMANTVTNNCRRGSEILVQGRYRFRTYVKRDGTQGQVHEVSASDLTLLQPSSPAQTLEDKVAEAVSPLTPDIPSEAPQEEYYNDLDEVLQEQNAQEQNAQDQPC